MRWRIIVTIFVFILLIIISINYESIDFNQERYISVEIKGEVIQDKSLYLPLGSSVDDALKEVDLTEEADLSTISLNSVLYNNQVIVIPKIQELDLISINSSSIEDLIKLPGIGLSLGQRIIDYRENISSFQNLEDLMNVKGIGESKFNKLKEYICL